jgi:hypothetical protein
LCCEHGDSLVNGHGTHERIESYRLAIGNEASMELVDDVAADRDGVGLLNLDPVQVSSEALGELDVSEIAREAELAA